MEKLMLRDELVKERHRHSNLQAGAPDRLENKKEIFSSATNMVQLPSQHEVGWTSGPALLENPLSHD